jgi:hypothetical protein
MAKSAILTVQQGQQPGCTNSGGGSSIGSLQSRTTSRSVGPGFPRAGQGHRGPETDAQKLAAFDPALHGGEAMAYRPIGRETL